MGRPKRKYDAKTAEQIQIMRQYGVPVAAVCKILKIGNDTIRNVYENELETGAAIANMEVGKRLYEQCLAGNVAALIFWAKCRMGWSEKASFVGREILERYRNGELSLKDAALELEMNGLPLPETIKILLAKEEPDPVDPGNGAYRMITDEELEKKVAARKTAIEAQINGLPIRQAEMRELRKKVSDKW